ncbi:YbgA family protein [Clostridium gasigenes]|nr:YbgA family protein [Clostridium gasigenes]
MAYSPSKQKKLGKIVAAARSNNINEALQEYKSLLVKAL